MFPVRTSVHHTQEKFSLPWRTVHTDRIPTATANEQQTTTGGDNRQASELPHRRLKPPVKPRQFRRYNMRRGHARGMKSCLLRTRVMKTQGAHRRHCTAPPPRPQPPSQPQQQERPQRIQHWSRSTSKPPFARPTIEHPPPISHLLVDALGVGLGELALRLVGWDPFTRQEKKGKVKRDNRRPDKAAAAAAAKKTRTER